MFGVARNSERSAMKMPDGSVSKPIEDMYPFLDRAEFHSEMIAKPINSD